MPDEFQNISIYLRTPEADKPEYCIAMTIDGKQKEYVVPISFDTLRLATKLHVEALMHYPVTTIKEAS